MQIQKYMRAFRRPAHWLRFTSFEPSSMYRIIQNQSSHRDFNQAWSLTKIEVDRRWGIAGYLRAMLESD